MRHLGRKRRPPQQNAALLAALKAGGVELVGRPKDREVALELELVEEAEREGR